MISINFNEENKKILIIGGGKQALAKGEKFANCMYLSPSFIEEVPEDKRILKVYEPSDIDGYFLVIAATNNKELNHLIVEDCNNKNILCANINNDPEASIHFQKELDYPFMHISFTTKGTCPGYHTVLERDLDALYTRHESILADLQVIRARAIETIHKYTERNDFIAKIVEKEPAFLHTLAASIQNESCKVITFHSHKTKESVEILEQFISQFETPCFYSFTEDLSEIASILKTLNVYADFYPITLRPGHSLNKMCNALEGECVHPITFTDKELSKMMRHAHYQIYVFHPVKNDTLKQKLARSYIVCDYNDELPEVEANACICLLLKASHFQNEIQELVNKNPNIHFDTKCLFEQDFFKEMILEKIG